MALRGQAIHPVTTLSLPQIVPSYCENKPELGQPENERPHGDNDRLQAICYGLDMACLPEPMQEFIPQSGMYEEIGNFMFRSEDSAG